MWSTHQNILALKFFIFLPNLKLSFVVIVLVRLCLIDCNSCSFTKNMVRPAPMGTIHRPSDYGSRGTDTTAFIQCNNGQELLINKLWCLGLDWICHKVHPTALVDIPGGTIRELVTNYLLLKIDVKY